MLCALVCDEYLLDEVFIHLNVTFVSATALVFQPPYNWNVTLCTVMFDPCCMSNGCTVRVMSHIELNSSAQIGEHKQTLKPKYHNFIYITFIYSLCTVAISVPKW